MDPRSQQNLDSLHPKFKQSAIAAWTEAQAAMPPNVKVIVIAGLRTFEESDALYKLGRTVVNPTGASPAKPMGNIVTKAKAGQSYHNYGLAFDFAMITNNHDDYDVGPHWMQVVSIMKKYGMTWGGTFPPDIYDAPHFENRYGYNWKSLLALHDAGTFIPGTTYVAI